MCDPASGGEITHLGVPWDTALAQKMTGTRALWEACSVTGTALGQPGHPEAGAEMRQKAEESGKTAGGTAVPINLTSWGFPGPQLKDTSMITTTPPLLIRE